MAEGIPLTDEEIAAAVRLAKGNLSAACRALEIDRASIARRVAASEDLQEIVRQARESMVDLAEEKLNNYIDGANLEAVKFALSTVGRTRGYGDVREIRGYHEVRTFSDMLGLLDEEEGDDE